jgi:glucokinase
VTILVADIGGTRIKIGVVREQIVLAREIIEARSHESLWLQLPRIADAFRRVATSSGVAWRECTAVAVAFPSLVDSRGHGKILTSYGKYEDAPGVDLQQWAREELGLPVIVENDSRVALLGEWTSGAGRGFDDLVMLTLGTGLGTSAIMNGQLIRGRHGQAGVLGGHLTVRFGGRRCTCGNRGCSEAEASTAVLPQVARENPRFATSRLSSASPIDYLAVFKYAREQDDCAIALYERSIEVWSALIVNLIHAYDPERVIVGGGIMAGAADFFADLRRSVYSNAHTPWGAVEIVAAELGDAAALFGGEILVKERLAG